MGQCSRCPEKVTFRYKVTVNALHRIMLCERVHTKLSCRHCLLFYIRPTKSSPMSQVRVLHRWTEPDFVTPPFDVSPEALIPQLYVPSLQLRHWSEGGPGGGEGLREGDVLVSNHPQLAGGSHLPDITVVTPVFDGGRIVFFVASRGHHADVGGITPGERVIK